MWRKERTSAKKMLGKGIQVSKHQKSNKPLRFFVWLYSFQTWWGWQRRGEEKKQDEMCSGSQREDAVACSSRRTWRGDVQRMDWKEAKGGRNGQNQATLKRCGYESWLVWWKKEEIGRIKEQRNLMRSSPGTWIVRTWRGRKWRHWREKRERKQEGEGFTETKQRVVKAGFGKHYKETKSKIPYEQRIVFVSGEVKGIAPVWLRSPVFCLQLLFSCMQYTAYFREGKTPFRTEMAIVFISQAVVLLCQPVYKQQHPG